MANCQRELLELDREYRRRRAGLRERDRRRGGSGDSRRRIPGGERRLNLHIKYSISLSIGLHGTIFL